MNRKNNKSNKNNKNPKTQNNMGLLGSIVGGLISGGFGVLNNSLAAQREQQAREQNYQLNEKSAEAADARTRALYNDLQSPEALLRQYQAAGLSPSLMFGGSGAGGGAQPASGAQGSGAGGTAPLYYGINPLEGAQIGLMNAQIEKIEAETKNVSEDTEGKKIANEVAQMQKTEYKTEFTLTNVYWLKSDGAETSIFEAAQSAKNYENFVKEVRHGLREGGDMDAYYMCSTVKGQETLKTIYMSTREMSTDIATLTESNVSATFQVELLQALKDEDFIKLNAKAATAHLRESVADAELEERQKEAWNNMLNKLEQKSETAHDIVVVLGIILNSLAGKVKAPHVTNIYKN